LLTLDTSPSLLPLEIKAGARWALLFFTISFCMQYRNLLLLVVLSLVFCTTYGQRVTQFHNMSREGDHRLFRRDYVKLTVEQLDSLKKKAGEEKIILYMKTSWPSLPTAPR
jgi:hypothetical protein